MCKSRSVKLKMSQELDNCHQTLSNPTPFRSNLKLITSLLPTVSDDVLDTIRAIVPPPPPVLTTLCARLDCDSPNSTLDDSDDSSLLGECLYTRRPTEESLLEKVRGPTYSVQEAVIKIEELFFQLIEPNKYTDKNELTDCILQIMVLWPEDSALQEQCLNCFVRLNEQNNDFCPSQPVLNSILSTMNQYTTNEMIYRSGFKLLMGKNIYNLLNCKIDLAKLVFNALCRINGVDYFIVYAKNIVRDLEPLEKSQLRAEKHYIEMLLDFPSRQNDTVTIMLRWCALDILVMLAEETKQWDTLISVDGQSKLQRLCQIPEFEDRCRFILDKTFPSHNFKVSESFMHSPAFMSITEKSLMQPKHRQVGNLSHECIRMAQGEKSLTQDNNEYNGRPLTPSPVHHTAVNFDDKKFSEDETLLSCSPPPEDCVRTGTQAWTGKENDLRNAYTPNQNAEQKSTSNNIRQNCTQKGVSKVGAPIKSKFQISVGSDILTSCIICKEPKGKHILLVKQLKQIAHCLHQPSNLLLFKCLEANICEDHRM